MVSRAYDPSDSSTLFQERTGASASTPAGVGDPVGTMLDKSGNGNHVTAVNDSARPTLSETGDGLRYLYFDGIDDTLTSTSTDFMSGVSASYIVSCDLDSEVFLYRRPGGTGFADFTFRLVNSKFFIYQPDPNTSSDITSRSNRNLHILSGYAENSEAYSYEDSTALDSRTSGAKLDFSNQTSGQQLCVGSNFSDQNWSEGQLYGLIFLNRVFSEIERKYTEEHLAVRSGFTL